MRDVYKNEKYFLTKVTRLKRVIKKTKQDFNRDLINHELVKRVRRSQTQWILLLLSVRYSAGQNLFAYKKELIEAIVYPG